MAAKQRNTEMDALLNTAQEETLSSGRKVKIFAVPWKNAAKFAAAAEPIFKLFLGDAATPVEPGRPVPHPDIPVEAVATSSEAVEAVVAPPAQPVPPVRIEEILSKLMRDHMDDMMALCECCTDMDAESLGYLQMDDAILISGTVITVNMTFFKQRLQGRLPALLEKLLGGNMESGLTAPPDSSRTATRSTA